MPSIVSMINMENDITYPPGVKGISEELPIEELVKRLKICAGVFQNFGQNDNVSCYENLALHIASEEFMNHSNKEVKLLTACIVADVFRVFAPDAPYREPALLKTIFLFFIEQLKGMKVNTGLYFQRHFYLLECLAWVKAFNICFDLDEGQEIFCKLFKLFFYLITDGQSAKVKNYMLDIMSAILVDVDNVSNELLEAILIWIIEPHKTQKKECFSLAKDLIKRTNNILEPYCQQYFTSVLFPDKEKDNGEIGNRDGAQIESDADAEKDNEIDQQLFGNLDKKSNKKRNTLEKINSQNPIYSKLHVYDFVHELYLIAPNLLVNVIPLLDFKLKSDKNDERLHVTRALGRMFSSIDSSLASENPILWKSFLGRFNDIEIPVRLACVQYSVHFLQNHPNLVGDIAEHMAPRAYDPDENVRHEVVAALVSACCPNTTSASSSASTILGPINISTTINANLGSAHNGPYCPLLLCDDGKLMDCLRSRTLDKKFRIRKEALMGLGTIYKTAYGLTNNGKQCQMAAPERLKLGWIRDQTMHAYYQNTTEDQILVERVFNTCIVPFNLSTPKRMYRLLHLFVNVDDHSLKALMEMWKKHFLLRTLAIAYVELRLKSLKTQPKNVNTLEAAVGINGNDKGGSSSKATAKNSTKSGAEDKIAKATLPAVDEINTKLYQISKMLPDPIKSLDYMKRFDQELKSDPKLINNLQTLLTETVSCKDACQLCKNILKRMGNPQASNQLYTNTKQFLERVAPLMIDPEAVICLCRIMEEYESLVEVSNKSGIHPFCEGEACKSPTGKSGTTSNPSGTKALSAAQKASNDLGRIKERGFRLLQALSCVFGNCFKTSECVEILSNFLQSKDDKTCEFALQILTNVVRTWHDIQKDALGSLLGTLQKLCKGSNPKHAKYAINSIQALLEHDDNKLKTINRSLLKLFGDYLKKPTNTVPYLMALSGLGQLALNRPEIASDIESMTRNLGLHLFPDFDENEHLDLNEKQITKGSTSLEKLSIPTDYWSSSGKDSVSHLCKARILYIKLRCKVLLGKQKMLQSKENPTNASDFLAETKEFFNFLFQACIYVKQPAPEAKTSSSRTSNNQTLNDYILLKLKATFVILKMVQTVTFWEILSVPHYQALARLICDVDCLEFRQKMVYKLHKGLFALKLPLEYMAILCLCHGETNKELKARCKQYLAANIAKRREFLRTNPAVYTSKIYAILPDYSLPYAIHLLAHSPQFSTKDDLKALETIKDALWFLIEPLMHKNENYSFSFFKKLIENIKQTKDAQNPTSIETNEKLYAVCDIALGLIWTRSSSFELKDFPGKPILPSKLYTQPMSTPNTQIYLPPQYAFSPAKKKVTRPDLNQFFSLVEDGKGSKGRVQIKNPRYHKATLHQDQNENDSEDLSQEKELNTTDSATTTFVDPKTSDSTLAKISEGQDSAGPSSLCSSTPKNQCQNISSPFETSLSKSPTVLSTPPVPKPAPIVAVSNQVASPYPTPPLSSQEGQPLEKSPKVYPKRKRGPAPKDVSNAVHQDLDDSDIEGTQGKGLSGSSSDDNSRQSEDSDLAPRKTRKKRGVAKNKRSISAAKSTKPKRRGRV